MEESVDEAEARIRRVPPEAFRHPSMNDDRFQTGGWVPSHAPEPVEGVRERVIAEIDKCVNGDRNADYGNPNQDFTRTRDFWNTYLHGVMERKLSALTELPEHTKELVLALLEDQMDSWDVGQMMTLLKISRSTVSPWLEDHYVDGGGYQVCAADCVDGAFK